MYFWDIDGLKSDLVSGPMPVNEQLKYLLAHSVAVGLATVPYLRSNWYDVLGAAVSVLIIAAGTYYLYQCNGGASGKRLLERYMGIGWVILIRFLLLVGVPGFLLYAVVYSTVAPLPEETVLADVIFSWILVVLWYVIAGRHFRHVASATA